MKIWTRRPAIGAVTACAVLGMALSPLTPPRAGALPARTSNDTIIVDYLSDLSTLDSARCYDTECYPWMHAMYDQLIGYDTPKGSGTSLIPDAATALPAVTNGGKTYTFKLRNDVHFWNGRLVTAADWIYSFERIIDPATQAGAASFWYSIVGADAFLHGKAPHVSGLKALGKFGLQITIKAPDASFLSVLAMPFGSVVDRNQIARYGKSYAALHPMGTGPYLFVEHTLGQRLVLRRNPNYFLKGVGRVTMLEADIGVTTDRSYLRVQRGESDLDGDFPTPIPPAEFLSVLADPKLKGQVVQQTQVATQAIYMNTQVKPFDNVLVRRAVNMAINKRRLVRLINGRGVVTDTFLPPNMPGYGKFSLYPYDPAAARKLLARAGFPNGFDTVFYSNNSADNPRITQAIIPMLATIGIRATPRIVDANTFNTIVGTKQKAPMTFDGWYEDFPDPNDFFEPILSCASAVPGTFNESWYCNPKVDAYAQKLKGMTDQAARLRLYPQLDRMVMEDAPVVPVFNSVYYILPSTALKGFYLHPVWSFVLTDYGKG